MRIHRIDIEGFGPFRERQSIDIDDVAADGLFLIAGPTGAGKSSILDAVSFALYDAVPRYDGDISRVRSDHSKPAEPSEVRLEFSMGGDRYRVTRSPKYLRPAKRGGGTTEQPSTAQLEGWTGAHWHGIAARPVDVAAALAPILVLSKDQFQQVILLAQNRFQRFLHAKDQERQALLRTLFRTERFEHIEQAFAERRRALAGEHERLLADGEARRERLDAALHEGERLAAASAPRAETPTDALIDADAAADGTTDPTAEPTPDPAKPDPPVAPPETEDAAITRALTTLTQHASAAHALAAEREQAERAAEAALSRAEHAARAQHRRDRALAEHRELDAATPLITAEEAALSAAAQAEAIRPARERSARAAAERAAAQTRLDAALAARHAAAIAASPEDALLTAEDTSQDPEDTNAPRVPDSADLDAEETRLNAEIEALAVAAAAELRLSGHRATRAKRTADADELDAALDALRAEREQLPAQLVRQRDALSQSEREAAGLPAARLARSAAEAEQRARREAAEHRERLAAAQRRVAEAAREASRAGAEFSRLVTARLDGFAAELAADLAEGHPCPVCGSAEHPAPAPTTADPVGQERIDEADALRLRLDAALTREREAEQEARLALADADARSGEGDDAA
ncbi:AAA family ATPase, partial [Leucobacter sp. M11]|uniref:AAA family ATPase n=1 Tax=Leucobacter sp. M11 TaxID=2993565 RepID=UPI002D7F1357